MYKNKLFGLLFILSFNVDLLSMQLPSAKGDYSELYASGNYIMKSEKIQEGEFLVMIGRCIDFYGNDSDLEYLEQNGEEWNNLFRWAVMHAKRGHILTQKAELIARGSFIRGIKVRIFFGFFADEDEGEDELLMFENEFFHNERKARIEAEKRFAAAEQLRIDSAKAGYDQSAGDEINRLL